MILVWDNGLDYSSHDIDFVDLGDVPLEHAVELMRMHDSDGYVLATADKLEWRANGSIGHLFDFVSPWFDLSKAGDVPRELCLRVLNYERMRLRALISENDKRVGEKWAASVNENLHRSLDEVYAAEKALAGRA